MGLDRSKNVDDWFTEHQGDLDRLARRLTGVGAAADDALQETWRIALERPPERSEGVGGWLRRVLRNVVFGRRRSEVLRRRLGTNKGEAHDDSPAAALERFETARVIARAIDDLVEPFKTAVVLRYFEGLEPDAIAKKLGIPASTVRSRLARGLAGLRTTLESRFGDDAARRSSALAFSAALLAARAGDAGGMITIILRSILMASKTKLAAAAVVLLCAVPMAYYVLRTDDEFSLENGAVTAEAKEDSGPRRAVIADDSPTSIPESAVSDILESFAVVESARLSISLQSDDGFGKESLAITVADPAHPETPLKSSFDSVGPKVDVDLSPLLSAGMPALLSVTIDHPLHLPETLVIDTARQNMRTEDGKKLFEISARLESASAFAGRVENRTGSPTDAKVAIYARDQSPKGVMSLFLGRSDGRRADAFADCDKNGAFFIRVPKVDRAMIIAAGKSLMPAHWTGNAESHAITDVGVLIVEAGVEVSGTIRAGQSPLGRARIKVATRTAEGKVERAGEGLRFFFGDSNKSETAGDGTRAITLGGESSDKETFRFEDSSFRIDAATGRLRKSVDLATCDAEGKFSIGGLRAGNYRLTFDGFDADVVETFAVGDKAKHIDVAAPSAGIDFALDAGFLTFVAVDPSDPAGEFDAKIVDPQFGEWRGKRSARDQRQVLVGSGRAIDASVEKAGFHEWSCKITSPAAGATTVITAELERDASARDLLIRIPGARKNGGRKLYVKFESIPIPAGKTEAGETFFDIPPLPQGAQGPFVAECGEGDEFRFKSIRIPFGRYRLLGRMNVPFSTSKDREETFQLFGEIGNGGEGEGEVVISLSFADEAPPKEDIENRRAGPESRLPGTDFTEAETEIDWIDARTIEATLPMIYGGRFSAVVHSDDGILREANLTIRTPGKTVVSTDGYAGRNSGRGRSGSTLTDEPILPYLGLPPGTYFVTAATREFPETTVEVSIKAGEITPIDILLLPK